MGMDIAIFANHKIDFSSNNSEIIANNIKELLDDTIIINRVEIQNLIRGYYDAPGYEDIRNKWQNEIDNWVGNDWHYYIRLVRQPIIVTHN